MKNGRIHYFFKLMNSKRYKALQYEILSDLKSYQDRLLDENSPKLYVELSLESDLLCEISRIIVKGFSTKEDLNFAYGTLRTLENFQK